MFVSAYKRILDENKPKSHPNASINFCFYRPPLPRKSSKQLNSRFPPKRPGPRVPGKRAIFPSLPPLTLSPLLSTPLPCTTSPPPLSFSAAPLPAPPLLELQCLLRAPAHDFGSATPPSRAAPPSLSRATPSPFFP